MRLAAILFVALIYLVAVAETSSSLPVQITYTWNQIPGAKTNVLAYVVLHGGPDGRVTNYANVRPYNSGRTGVSWPLVFSYTLSNLPQGTNYVGVTASLKSGVAGTNISVHVNTAKDLQ